MKHFSFQLTRSIRSRHFSSLATHHTGSAPISPLTTPATPSGVPNAPLNAIHDTKRWEQLQHRQDDIFIVTTMKAGTTWMQNIVGNLLFQGQTPSTSFFDMSPWFELRANPAENVLGVYNSQTHRRFLKSHSAMDVIPFFEECKYIYVGRDFRDITMSMFNMYHSLSGDGLKLLEKARPEGLPKCPDNIHDFIKPFLSRGVEENENDGYPWWSSCHHLRTWFDFKHLDNIYFVHHSDLLIDLDGEMRKIADFLGIPIENEQNFENAVHACTFKYMKENAASIAPKYVTLMTGGAKSFVFKGTNGRWKSVFTEEEHTLYERMMSNNLSEPARDWVERDS